MELRRLGDRLRRGVPPWGRLGPEDDADLPPCYAIARIFPDWLQFDSLRLPIAQDLQIHRLPTIFPDNFGELRRSAHMLTIRRNNDIAFLQLRSISRRALRHRSDHNRFCRIAEDLEWLWLSGYARGNQLAITLDRYWLRVSGSGKRQFQEYTVPSGIFDAAERHDVVSRLDAGFLRGRILHHAGNNHRLIRIRGLLAAMHKESSGKHNGHQEVGRRAGQRDQHALPAWLGKELIGIAPPLFRRIIAGHAHVAAERQRAQAIIGWPAARPNEARADANGENLDAHTKQPGDEEVAPFVDQNHDAQPDRDRYDSRQHGKSSLNSLIVLALILHASF